MVGPCGDPGTPFRPHCEGTWPSACGLTPSAPGGFPASKAARTGAALPSAPDRSKATYHHVQGRKRNASFNAIAQQPSDMLGNEAGKALIKQARQMVLFKNEKAEEADYVTGLGCTPAEFHAVREGMLALPYHSVLIKRQDGQSSLCRFDLSTLPQHLNVLAGEPKRVVLLRGCLNRHGGDIPKALAEFNRRILETAA